jgi:adenosylmethionine-8-amino-7-oxononanoate aminotransferase
MKDSILKGQEHIWRPFTKANLEAPLLQVKSADGVRIRLEDGRELIDGIASWWVMCHGYNHPQLKNAIKAQLEILPHIMIGGMIHAPACELSAALAKILPQGLNKIFYSESGSVAVEAAMKLAVQYHDILGYKLHKFLSFKNSYHGDTMATMSLSIYDDAHHSSYENYVTTQHIVDIPERDEDFAKFDEYIAHNKHELAAIVIEPLIQAAGGMKFHTPEQLARIYQICKNHGLLFIADEIAVGFMRTGTMFACEQADITPDILCLGKALSGGMLPLAATITTDKIYDIFLKNDKDCALQGSTFMANPLACAVSIASLKLFENTDYKSKVQAIEQQLKQGLAACLNSHNVIDVRVMGAVAAVQIDPTKLNIFDLRKYFPTQGAFIRPLQDVVYLMPPLVIERDDLQFLIDVIVKVL